MGMMVDVIAGKRNFKRGLRRFSQRMHECQAWFREWLFWGKVFGWGANFHERSRACLTYDLRNFREDIWGVIHALKVL